MEFYVGYTVQGDLECSRFTFYLAFVEKPIWRNLCDFIQKRPESCVFKHCDKNIILKLFTL